MIALLLTWLCWPWLIWRARARSGPPRKILLIQTAKIGDMLCATPVMAALHRAHPQAELTVLHDPVTTQIIAGHPAVQQRLALPTRAFRGLRGRWALLRLLRAGGYDTVLTLSPNLAFWLASIAIVIAAICFMLTKIELTEAEMEKTSALKVSHALELA